MGEFRSTSQAGQDAFVRALTRSEPGRFLDVGCSDPEVWSNTRGLEEAGWRGILVDKNPDWTRPNWEQRKGASFYCQDACRIDWSLVFLGNYEFDYLSFDVDEDSLRAFSNMPWGRARFRVLTIEHDAYRFGGEFRAVERAVLSAHGYELLCPDVSVDGCPFEDWWVHPARLDMPLVEELRSARGTDWKDVAARADAITARRRGVGGGASVTA